MQKESKPARLLRLLKRRPLTSLQIQVVLKTTLPRDNVYRAKKLLQPGEDIASLNKRTKDGTPYVKYVYTKLIKNEPAKQVD